MMSRRKTCRPLLFLCAVTLVLGPAVNPVLSQSAVSGRMAGRVFDKATKGPLAGVTVRAKLVTANELFASRETNPGGSYSIPELPAGIYALSLAHEGTEYAIEGRFDVRAGMNFFFESCFELDRARGTGALRPDCSSGFYAESQVVALGPHRYFRTELIHLDSQEVQSLDIGHEGRECFARDRYPELSSDVSPYQDVRFSRVYFRAAQHSDFYYVDMRDTGGAFQAVLPKPSPGTTEIVYYMEAINNSFDGYQSSEFIPRILLGEICDERDPGAYFTGGDPGIVVGSVVEGAAMLPPGFLPQGIGTFITASGSVVSASAAAAAAGGGSFLTSTVGLILIVSAAGAATVVGVNAGGEKEASSVR